MQTETKLLEGKNKHFRRKLNSFGRKPKYKYGKKLRILEENRKFQM